MLKAECWVLNEDGPRSAPSFSIQHLSIQPFFGLSQHDPRLGESAEVSGS